MLRGKIKSNLQQAQLQRDEIKVSTLRLLLSAISYADIASSGEISDEEILTVVQKEVKKRKEAAAGFRQGGREESAQKEEEEAKILESYLPEPFSDDELTKIIQETITDTGAKSVSDMGRVIGVVMGKVKGKAEGGKVSALVKEKLDG